MLVEQFGGSELLYVFMNIRDWIDCLMSLAIVCKKKRYHWNEKYCKKLLVLHDGCFSGTMKIYAITIEWNFQFYKVYVTSHPTLCIKSMLLLYNSVLFRLYVTIRNWVDWMHICDQFNSIKIATLQKAELMSDARKCHVQHSLSSNCILFEHFVNQSPVVW
jgi:hypothetical protein